ncbi:MAG TPA: CDP-glucose 4,6-dehydratase [Desulfobacteraceae bacterium]|nr:CDP-glucose 4,6-dehydratase [Desulfobacteraceae bacterium]
MVMDGNFWQDKRVLITGHTGFKGSWLSLWLQRKGARTIGFALDPPTSPSLFEIARVAGGMISIIGDIRNLKHLREVISKHKPEIIFHMAAQALVRYSYNNPVDTYSTNIMGTVNILEAVRNTGIVRIVVNITSDKCYENKEWLWGYRENESMGGYDPYSSSKGCAELVTSAYRQSYFSDNNPSDKSVMVATTRAGNVIGGGDWAQDRLVPDIMNAIIENRSPVIRYPNAVRPWQHVLEPLRGYLMLAEKLWNQGKKYAGAWNFGPDDAQPVSWVADHLANLWGVGSRWKTDMIQNPHEAAYLKLDCSKAKSLLGWSSKLDLLTALEWINKWYKAYVENKDMRKVTEDEIIRYEALL